MEKNITEGNPSKENIEGLNLDNFKKIPILELNKFYIEVFNNIKKLYDNKIGAKQIYNLIKDILDKNYTRKQLGLGLKDLENNNLKNFLEVINGITNDINNKSLEENKEKQDMIRINLNLVHRALIIAMYKNKNFDEEQKIKKIFEGTYKKLLETFDTFTIKEKYLLTNNTNNILEKDLFF